jgi:hypothetical protein
MLKAIGVSVTMNAVMLSPTGALATLNTVMLSAAKHLRSFSMTHAAEKTTAEILRPPKCEAGSEWQADAFFRILLRKTRKT